LDIALTLSSVEHKNIDDTRSLDLGKIKTEQIKRVGKELMERFPNKFTTNFEENKHLVDTLTQGTSTRVRNQIAGYITRTKSLAKVNSGTEPVVSEESSE
jgi:small subunit ribosomal protein S17e